MKRHRSIRRLGLWIVLALLMVVSTLVAIAFLALQSQPLVVEVEQLTPERASQGRDLASRIMSDFLTAKQPRDFELSEGELKGLLALAERAIPRIRGRINVTGSGVEGALTVSAPSNPFGSYLNLSALVRPSIEGLDLAYIRIGSLRLPGVLAELACRLVLNVALGGGNGTAMLNMIREVRITQDKVIVTFYPLPGFEERMASARQRLKRVGRIFDPR
jgi:hypothetical protein